MEFNEKNVFNAIKLVAEWEVLALQLGFKEHEIRIIKRDSSSTSGAIIRLIGEWMQSDKDPSWKTLAGALQLMGYKKLADSLYLSDFTAIVETKNIDKEHEQLKWPVGTETIDEIATASMNSKRNIERSILRLKKRFGFIVKATKKEILSDERKIRELPDIIEYGLPQRLKGLRNFVTCTSLTKDNFHHFFQALERMWSFIDHDLLRTIIYEFENFELMNKIDAYITEVDKFCAQTTIYDFIQVWKPRYDGDEIPKELIICVTELSLDIKTSKVEELKKIQRKLKHSLPQELAMAAFYICNMAPGSLKISWLVWAECLPEVMDKLKGLIHTELITEINIHYLSLDSVILYSAYNDQMLDAILSGDIQVVEKLLDNKRVDPNYVHHNCEVINHASSLVVACFMGHVRIVQALILHNAEVDLLTNGVSPLLIASENGHTEIIRELISYGTEVNRQNNIGASPLFVASENGHTETVRELIAEGAHIDLREDTIGASPLYVASENGHTETVRELIAEGAHINLREDTIGASPLYVASQNGHTETVKVLIAKGAEIDLQNNNGASPLYIASEIGHFETVRELITNGAQINQQDDTGASPLYCASENGHTETVRELIANGAKIDLEESTIGASPLYVASENGHTETVKELIASSAQINLQEINETSPLYIASFHGYTEIVRELIVNGALVNMQNSIGASPLYAASFHGHTETVRELLEHGAEINLQDNTGASPLYIASQNGHTETVRELIRRGAQIDLQENTTGASPLIIACQEKHLDTVSELIANGAQVHLQNKDGASPLYVASECGHMDIVKELITNGAQINLQET